RAVREGEDLPHLVLAPPHTAELVLRPAARRRSHDLALGGALAGPATRLEILFEDFDWSAVVAFLLDFLVAQDAAPGLGLAARRGADAAAGAALASSARIRAFSASFSSRAAAAIALTAS